MRISNLQAADECNLGGEHKDNTFQITAELTASELYLFISSLDWMANGLRDTLGSGALDENPDVFAKWGTLLTEALEKKTILEAIKEMIF